jgi:carboxyl-terminal processing protease
MAVENQGQGPFYRLSAVTKSDDPLFSNLEFPLGEINPGDKKEWTVPLKIQEMASERSEPVTFLFHEFYDHTPANQEYDLTIAAPTKPHFSYSYTLIDGQEKGTKGNSNNQPEAGETVGIKVTVKNDGPGASTKPVINVKNNGDEEVFLEKGRLELSPLPAGGSASGLLLVRIQQDKKIDLELFITDTLLGEDLSDHLIWEKNSLTPSPGVEHIPPHLTLEPANPVLKASGSSYRLKGVATDNEKMLQVYIFVNSEKVFYASQAGDPKSLPLGKLPFPNFFTSADYGLKAYNT